mgnify:CR=1 FL=1
MVEENKKNKIITIFILSIWLLIVNVNAFSPLGNSIYEGIDVSQWQEEINYLDVKKDGIEIVYIKSSEGNNFIDPYFETNYERAKDAGLKIGFYHYMLARSIEDAENEAKFFASVISDKEASCKLAMDFESFGNLTIGQINEISEVFLNKVKNITGKEVVIYSDVYNARNVFSKELANKYPIWIAEYGVEKPAITNWDNWIGFQYTDRGRIAGINDNVDRDKFTEEIFLEDISKIPNNFVNKSEENTYIVKKGDTLSLIAIEFNTSISTLVKLNNIKNQNLIFPNQVLIINSGKINDLNHILYVVKPGDNLTKISKKYNVSITNIVELNDIKNPNLIEFNTIV